MTVSIRIQGANFSKFGDIDPTAAPYIGEAVALYLLGGDSTESLKNRVPNSPYPLATEIGAPIYGKGYARVTCQETDGIDSGFTFASQEHTHVVIVARNNSANRIFAGYWQQSNTHTEASISMGASFDTVGLFMDGSGRVEHSFNPALGQFSFMATTYDGTNAKAYAHDGVSLGVTSALYNAGAVDTGAPYLIGASGVGSGSFDIAVAMTFNRALNSTELQELYDYFKGVMSSRGINLL